MNICLNARFAGRRITGVERFAHEISVRLLPLLERGSDRRAAALAPGNPPAADLCELRPLRLPLAVLVLWEQFVLPVRTGAGFLVSLSNTGPLSLRRQLVVIHDASVFALPGNYAFGFRVWYKLALNVLLRRAEKVVTVSAFSRKELARYGGVPAERIEVVPEGSDHLDAVASEPRILARSGLAPGRYVLAVGTPSRSKNLGVLIEAMTRLRDTGLVLALAGELESGVFRRPGLAPPPWVRMLGYVSDAELKALYEQALCFVFASRYEGFGLPPLEAMRCGCPVVASNAASLPEVCGDAALYADPDDPAQLAKCIRSLEDSAEKRDAYRVRGRARAGGYTWAASAARLLELIVACVEDGA